MGTAYFSVFTPVYNGEKHIHRVFESIEQQVYRNFEWIIVNDGSIDNTPSLIKSFIQLHPELDITYIEQPNSGKHNAWNLAVKLAKGLLFVPADADDYFIPETLLFFYEKWNGLPQKEQMSMSGINVLCYDNNSNDVLGTPFPVNGMKTNNIELEYKYKIRGEKWGCIRTDLLKSRPFPIIKGTHFPEGYLWFHFSRNYSVICFNKPLRRYFTTETGIMQTELKGINNRAQYKVHLKYYSWKLRNFGLYILIHKPEDFIKSCKIILKFSYKLLFK